MIKNKINPNKNQKKINPNSIWHCLSFVSACAVCSVLVLFVFSYPTLVEGSEWQLVGPGGGGQITSITEDPSNLDNLYLTINVGGARKSTDGGNTWQIINRGLDYETLGKGAQQMMDTAVHPEHSNVVLAAGLNGDIYESTNGGREWKLSYRHPGQKDNESYDYSRFVFDPEESDTVYIGVGSIQKLILGVSARRTGDYWPRIDQGPTILRGTWTGSRWNWQEAGSIGIGTVGKKGRGGGDYLNIYSIGINPSNTKDMFFVTEKGLYNGQMDSNGKINSFERLSTESGLPRAADVHGGKIVFDMNNPGVAYLTLLNLDNLAGAGGVFKSTDYGKTWAKLTNGLDDNSNYFDIQIDPKDSNVVYVAQFFLKLEEGWVNGNLYRTRDAGASWEKLIMDDRSNIDAGWQQVEVEEQAKIGAHFVSVSKFNNMVLWNKGGILFKNDDLSKRYPQWTNMLTKKVGQDEWATTGSEAVALAFSIGIDPNDSDKIYLPYGDHCYFKSANGGGSLGILVDNSEMKEAGNRYDSGIFVVDRFDGNRFYVATQGPHQQLDDGGVMISKDGGKTWDTIGGHLKKDQRGLPRGAMTDLLVEYDGGKRNLYVANYGKSGDNPNTVGGVYLLLNADSTNDWQNIFSMEKGAYKLASKDNFNTLYVGVNKEGSNGYGIYKLVRNINLWQIQKGPIPVGDSTAFNDLETGPSSENIYVATNRGLFVIDGNDRITEIAIPQFEALKSKGIDPDAQALEIFSGNEDIIYVASPNTEILKSYNGGLTWEEISNDIPTLGFIILNVDLNQDVIYAESPGGGIWKRSFSDRRCDLNNDGTVNVIDVQLCVNVFLGLETNPDIVARADVNQDGSVNVIDVQRIVNVFLGG